MSQTGLHMRVHCAKDFNNELAQEFFRARVYVQSLFATPTQRAPFVAGSRPVPLPRLNKFNGRCRSAVQGRISRWRGGLIQITTNSQITPNSTKSSTGTPNLRQLNTKAGSNSVCVGGRHFTRLRHTRLRGHNSHESGSINLRWYIFGPAHREP